jgi:hypothetical protein
MMRRVERDERPSSKPVVLADSVERSATGGRPFKKLNNADVAALTYVRASGASLKPVMTFDVERYR